MKVHKNSVFVIILSTLFLLLAILGGLYLDWQNNYKNKIYPGARIGKINLEKLTFNQAEELIKNRTEKIQENGFKIKNGEKIINISTDIFSFDSDLSTPTLSFDYLASAQAAYGDESDRTFFKYLLHALRISKVSQIKMVYDLDENKLKDLLNSNLSDLNIESSNAYFIIDKNNEIKIMPEKLGKIINYSEALADFKNNLDNLDDSIVNIKTQTKYPEIGMADLAGLSAEAKNVIGTADLVLAFQEIENTASSSPELTWTIKPETLITWLSISKSNGKPGLSLTNEKIKEYLEKTVSPKILIEPVLPRFEIKNNKVTSWQNGAKGRELDLEKSVEQINQRFLQNERKIFLIAEASGEVDLSPTNDLNINEIIGTGYSDFTGSPVNRIKNIRVGAAAAQGLLIKPGEEFSLVKTLGDVSKETGYFPELVIKGNKTVPEYGGGLCQIGTTVFRAALASGLPITSRQNHSYRVAYYEPAGTDAAIYIPNPDVRFINDTNNYILIQVRIVKTKIYFDFWGTKDGRIATTTTPVIYNITKPAPTKLIETTDLAAGIKKCTEHAHNGADAYFDYKVIYPANATGTPIQERRFKSHYVPWQEVCLIGVGTATSSTNISSTTPIISNNNTTTKATSSIIN
ncbi:MAG: VanW family protein [Patescibacteria group bacterium]